jgi:hypothetical protein
LFFVHPILIFPGAMGVFQEKRNIMRKETGLTDWNSKWNMVTAAALSDTGGNVRELVPTGK